MDGWGERRNLTKNPTILFRKYGNMTENTNALFSTQSSSSTGSLVQYNQKIVAFLDILGFRDLLKDENKLRALKNYVAVLGIVFRSDQSYESSAAVTQVSDGIVISSMINDLGTLDRFMHHIAQGIDRLMCLGIVVRGAIAYGHHYQKDEILISPAFVAAYDLERDVAKYPRVVLDLSVIKLQRELYEPQVSPDDLPLNKYTKRDRDGYRFIDFIKTEFEPNHDESSETVIYGGLNLIRRTIEGGFASSKSNSVRAKYIWLANYYNDSIKNDLGLDRQVWARHQVDQRYLELPDLENPNFEMI